MYSRMNSRDYLTRNAHTGRILAYLERAVQWRGNEETLPSWPTGGMLEDRNMAGEMATWGPQRPTEDEVSLTLPSWPTGGSLYLRMNSRDDLRNSQQGSLS